VPSKGTGHQNKVIRTKAQENYLLKILKTTMSKYHAAIFSRLYHWKIKRENKQVLQEEKMYRRSS
jgi:hypothetical protein